jgi:hypothetical protein
MLSGCQFSGAATDRSRLESGKIFRLASDLPPQADKAHALQLGSRLLVTWLKAEHTFIEVFDLTARKKLYALEVDGSAIQVESRKTDEWDYRLIAGRSITYRSSADPQSEKTVHLPDSIPDTSRPYNSWFDHDPARNAWIYQSSDGIHYLAEDQPPRLVLANSGLTPDRMGSKHTEYASADWPEDTPDDWRFPYYKYPHLMNQGQTISAVIDLIGLQSEGLGLTLYDVNTGKTDDHWDVFSAMISGIHYLSDDILITYQNDMDTLINAATGEKTVYPVDHWDDGRAVTFDYTLWLKLDQTPSGCTMTVSDAEESLLISAEQEPLHWLDVTEQYAVVRQTGVDGRTGLIVLKYR